MEWFGGRDNGDEYCRTEPGYGRMAYSDHVNHPVILDSNGGKHSIVGYAANYNAQRYEAKTEQVVRYGNVPNFPAMADHKYRNPRKEGYKDHGVGDKPHPVPRISAPYRPEKDSEFSPKARDEVVHRQSKNPPWNNGYRDRIPPSTDQYRTSKYPDDEDEVICNDGVCLPNYFKDENYNKNEKHKGNGYNPPTYTVPTQPRSKDHANNYYESNINKPTATSPPQFNAIPKRDQGYPETIDSTEARRRSGVARPVAEPGPGYDQGRTIDSNELARLCGGVFL